MTAVTWTPVSCMVAGIISGARGIVHSDGRADDTGTFREYSTLTGIPVLREWTSLPADAPCRHEVPGKAVAS